MRGINMSLIILVAFIPQAAHAKDSQDNLVGKLVGRVLKPPHVHDEDLNGVTLAKPAQLAVRTPISPVVAARPQFPAAAGVNVNQIRPVNPSRPVVVSMSFGTPGGRPMNRFSREGAGGERSFESQISFFKREVRSSGLLQTLRLRRYHEKGFERKKRKFKERLARRAAIRRGRLGTFKSLAEFEGDMPLEGRSKFLRPSFLVSKNVKREDAGAKIQAQRTVLRKKYGLVKDAPAP